MITSTHMLTSIAKIFQLRLQRGTFLDIPGLPLQFLLEQTLLRIRNVFIALRFVTCAICLANIHPRDGRCTAAEGAHSTCKVGITLRIVHSEQIRSCGSKEVQQRRGIDEKVKLPDVRNVLLFAVGSISRIIGHVMLFCFSTICTEHIKPFSWSHVRKSDEKMRLPRGSDHSMTIGSAHVIIILSRISLLHNSYT